MKVLEDGEKALEAPPHFPTVNWEIFTFCESQFEVSVWKFSMVGGF